MRRVWAAIQRWWSLTQPLRLVLLVLSLQEIWRPNDPPRGELFVPRPQREIDDRQDEEQDDEDDDHDQHNVQSIGVTLNLRTSGRE
jgi:hypothetical protein